MPRLVRTNTFLVGSGLTLLVDRFKIIQSLNPIQAIVLLLINIFGGLMNLRTRFKSKTLIVIILLLSSSLAIAGIHAYTNNLKVTDSLYHAIYWSEIGSNYPTVRMGE